MAKNKWALGFCDCCSYRDEEDKCWFFPTFFPQALCGTCCIEGEIYSIINDESRCCCRMGSGGLCRCIIQVPIGILGPFGGIPLAICCGAKTRHEVITKYEMSDGSSGICCGTCIGIIRLIILCYGEALTMSCICRLVVPMQLISNINDVARVRTKGSQAITRFKYSNH